MSSTDLKKEIKKYIDRADERTLKIVHAVLEAENDYSTWNDLPSRLKKSINKSIKEADEGKFIPHEEAVKKYRKWLSK
jgi:predicted transcriptional regulator